MQDIGGRIKKIRLNKGLALKELASKSGLTSSFLSQLENGMTSPSVASLHKIADALGIKVANLFQEGEGAEFVFLRKQRNPHLLPGYPESNYEILASSVLDIKILPLLLKLQKDEVLGADACPQGDEMLGVSLQGKVEVMLEGKNFTLEQSDSIYLVKPKFRSVKNLAGNESRILWCVLRQ
jgi:transcriptional regulator with XRE-family HTH domain